MLQKYFGAVTQYYALSVLLPKRRGTYSTRTRSIWCNAKMTHGLTPLQGGGDHSCQAKRSAVAPPARGCGWKAILDLKHYETVYQLLLSSTMKCQLPHQHKGTCQRFLQQCIRSADNTEHDGSQCRGQKQNKAYPGFF